MAKKSLNLTDGLYDYMLNVSLREPDVVRRLREETARMLMYAMQSPPEQGQFMTLLIKLINARKTIEIGTFTGYSALWTALTLPPEGKVVACDIYEKWTSIGRKYWKEAGIEHKIDLRIAPALETMDKLIKNNEANSFDYIFIDADKENYINYYERALILVRVGGLIAIDNVFWGGTVIDPEYRSREVKAIREINELIHKDDRVELSMLPVGDGLTLAIRKK